MERPHGEPRAVGRPRQARRRIVAVPARSELPLLSASGRGLEEPAGGRIPASEDDARAVGRPDGVAVARPVRDACRRGGIDRLHPDRGPAPVRSPPRERDPAAIRRERRVDLVPRQARERDDANGRARGGGAKEPRSAPHGPCAGQAGSEDQRRPRNGTGPRGRRGRGRGGLAALLDDRRDQPVAALPYRLDDARGPGVVAEQLPQLPDRARQDVLRDVRAVPDDLQELVLRDDLAGTQREREEDVHDLRLDTDGLVADRHAIEGRLHARARDRERAGALDGGRGHAAQYDGGTASGEEPLGRRAAAFLEDLREPLGAERRFRALEGRLARGPLDGRQRRSHRAAERVGGAMQAHGSLGVAARGRERADSVQHARHSPPVPELLVELEAPEEERGRALPLPRLPRYVAQDVERPRTPLLVGDRAREEEALLRERRGLVGVAAVPRHRGEAEERPGRPLAIAAAAEERERFLAEPARRVEVSVQPRAEADVVEGARHALLVAERAPEREALLVARDGLRIPPPLARDAPEELEGERDAPRVAMRAGEREALVQHLLGAAVVALEKGEGSRRA